MPDSASRKARRWRVIDSEAAAELVRRLQEKLAGGSERKLALVLGVTAPVLRRIRDGAQGTRQKLGDLEPKTVHALANGTMKEIERLARAGKRDWCARYAELFRKAFNPGPASPPARALVVSVSAAGDEKWRQESAAWDRLADKNCAPELLEREKETSA